MALRKAIAVWKISRAATAKDRVWKQQDNNREFQTVERVVGKLSQLRCELRELSQITFAREKKRKKTFRRLPKLSQPGLPHPFIGILIGMIFQVFLTTTRWLSSEHYSYHMLFAAASPLWAAYCAISDNGSSVGVLRFFDHCASLIGTNLQPTTTERSNQEFDRMFYESSVEFANSTHSREHSNNQLESSNSNTSYRHGEDHTLVMTITSFRPKPA